MGGGDEGLGGGCAWREPAFASSGAFGCKQSEAERKSGGRNKGAPEAEAAVSADAVFNAASLGAGDLSFDDGGRCGRLSS